MSNAITRVNKVLCVNKRGIKLIIEEIVSVEFPDDIWKIIKEYMLDKFKINCNCHSGFDIRNLCFPIDDYINLKPHYITGLKHDFRKCPERINSASEFILNDYYLFNSIAKLDTEQKRISAFKQIIIKKFKLTIDDYTIVFNNYINETDNIINNKEEEYEI